MTDTELLNALLGMLDRGMKVIQRYRWILNGNSCTMEHVLTLERQVVTDLMEKGELQLQTTGCVMQIGTGPQEERIWGDGASMREAIEDAVRKVAAGATGKSAGTPANPSGAPGVADTPAATG